MRSNKTFSKAPLLHGPQKNPFLCVISFLLIHFVFIYDRKSHMKLICTYAHSDLRGGCSKLFSILFFEVTFTLYYNEWKGPVLLVIFLNYGP